ncbi:hypothetical protein [Rhizobium rhizogenes]|uniref:hypothetical protein n=1 Tax=Rhizobium rhizogenes TaxID=359 RepID=UPI001572FCD2|nr:hypothetical protein [Rhizobium rhizogenes]NTG94222.1 hypothetical protein [Rhizobium rhizogenes]
MMADKTIDDGGPAFARSGFYSDGGPGESDCWPTDGMSLRDWFSGQALAGLVGNPGGPYQANGQNGWDIVNCDVNHVAETCFRLADAMIAARKVGAA